MSVREKLELALCQLHPSEQLKEIEKLGMKIRKANSIRIESERMKMANKYPRIRS